MRCILSSGFGILFLLQVTAICPDGFQKHSSNCYKVLALEASWIEARSYCKMLAIGTDLLIVESAAEEAIIEGILTRLHGSHIDETYWIDGTDIVDENDWRWMRGDGASIPITNYTNWGHGRPDNVGGNENCLLINYNHGRTYWNDRNCQEQHSFICEIGDPASETVAVVG